MSRKESAWATRPRSRRGRHPPPGELDPVAESSEEAEAAGGSSKATSELSQDCLGQEPLDPIVETSGQGPESWTKEDAAMGPRKDLAPSTQEQHQPALEAHQTPEAPPQDGNTVPTRNATPDMFETLQQALSSLEATAAACHHHSRSCSRLIEAEGRNEGGPGPVGKQEWAGHGQLEAARLSEKNTWLRLALGSREEELVRTQVSLQAAQAETETLQRQVQELQDSLMQLEASSPPCHSQARGRGSDSSSSGAEREAWETQQDSPGPHPLLRHLQSDSSTQIVQCLPTQAPAPEMHPMEDQMKQLRGNIEKLKCFNRLLLAVLQGYKGRCEGLSMQLGQREAEVTALRLALQYSENCEEAYGVLLALREAGSEAKDKGTTHNLQAAEKEATRLLTEKEAAMNRVTPQPSPEGSSVDKPTPQELAAELQGYVQHLLECRALVKIPPEPGPTTTPWPTMPHAEAMVQNILETQTGPALPRLEKSQIQQDLVATRESLADLMLQLQLVQREKRGLELREAALRAQGPAHVLLLEQFQWERSHLGAGGGVSSDGDSSRDGSSEDEEDWAQGPPALPGGPSGIDKGQMGKVQHIENLSQELAASLTRAEDLLEQLHCLRQQLEQVAQKGRARCIQSAELNRELCKAHSALVLAFRAAHKKQEEQRWKLEQQVAQLQAQQVVELGVLEATIKALEKPGAMHSPPQLGETFL
uniref:Usher syndrome type-1C protein-binding protein 1 isoform X1 n=2 Tax=Jaculus jaculus TaxID=51337 RepID=UPI001E1B1C4F|nr:Usher syndrome type-1C protein-binding protein 1 isoform X1 [Jaculus jaculus]